MRRRSVTNVSKAPNEMTGATAMDRADCVGGSRRARGTHSTPPPRICIDRAPCARRRPLFPLARAAPAAAEECIAHRCCGFTAHFRHRLQTADSASITRPPREPQMRPAVLLLLCGTAFAALATAVTNAQGQKREHRSISYYGDRLPADSASAVSRAPTPPSSSARLWCGGGSVRDVLCLCMLFACCVVLV